MPNPISFFVGATTSVNVQHLVRNLDWMLTDSPPVDLVTTQPDTYDNITDSFHVRATAFESSFRDEYAGLREYLSRQDPAVLVQLTRPPIHGTLCGAAVVRKEVPFVYRYSGDRFYEWKVARGKQRVTGFAVGNLLGRIPLKIADKFVALGPSGIDRLAARGVDRERITILPPSVDRTRFELPSENPVDIPGDRSMILFVGRLSRLKGLETFERTIPRILDRRDDIQFVFAGDEQATLEIPPHDRNNVTILGSILPEDIPAYYQQADLLAHPSLTDGIPRVVLEALASETPVVARDVGDVSTVTENTFTADEEFVEMVSKFESLPLDDVTPFTRESLQPKYRSFFESFRDE